MDIAKQLAENYDRKKSEQDKVNQNYRDSSFDKNMDIVEDPKTWDFPAISGNYDGYRSFDGNTISIWTNDASESKIDERAERMRMKGFNTEKKMDRMGARPVLEISMKINDPEDELKKVKIDPSETFDYLLRMQIVCLNIASKAYKELERKKSNLEAQIKDIENTTVEALWRREMQELKDAHKKWEKRIADDAKVPKRTKGTKAKAKE